MNEPLQKLSREAARAQDALLEERSDLGRARVALLHSLARGAAPTARRRLVSLLILLAGGIARFGSSWFARPGVRLGFGVSAVFLLGLALGSGGSY